MRATLKERPETRTSRAGRSGTPRVSQRGGISFRFEMVAPRARARVKIRLPAAAGLLVARERLVDLLAAILALLQMALEHARQEDEDGEEDDEQEARVRDDLVVGGAVPALAAVVGQRGGREDQQHEGGDG